MSKSLGNVIRIRDALKEHTASELRFYFASFHYRQPMIFSESGLRRAKRELAALKKALQTFFTAEAARGPKDEKKLRVVLEKAELTFRRSMDNDFDTPKALRVLMRLAKDLATFSVGREAKAETESAFLNMASVVGILP
jgi:cysteinyl-tRNA synthetase